jgi:hypothetical protein
MYYIVLFVLRFEAPLRSYFVADDVDTTLANREVFIR